MTAARFVPPARNEAAGLGHRVQRRLVRWCDRHGRRLAAAGLPPELVRHRWRRHRPAAEAALDRREIHSRHRAPAALPTTIADRAHLPPERGWWGFSFRDVPDREVAPTRLLRVADARVLAGRTADGAAEFFPAVLNADGHSLDLREINFRPFHAALASRPPDIAMDRAVWVAERVFDNYAHWFSAHLPKLVLLRDLGELEGLVLPASRPDWLDASLERIGIRPSEVVELPRGGVLAARSLILVETDRFRPELLNAARTACADPPGRPHRRLFVSRRRARGRRLLNEEALLPELAAHGFTAVAMEDLDLAAQIRLMAETEVLLAPHGAGLTNMLFCPPGTEILEIADPSYPNPNFYAMAAALGHAYGWLPASGVGDRHPLRQDLLADEAALRSALRRWR